MSHPAAARWSALTSWCLLVWFALTLTPTLETVVVGIVVSGLLAVLLAPLGAVAGPWVLLRPGRLRPGLVLGATLAAQVVRANLSLARRVWSPRLPARTVMVVLPPRARSDGAVTATALLTSLVVDDQLVDLDRRRDELLYHCIEVPPPDRRQAEVTEPVAGLVLRVEAARG